MIIIYHCLYLNNPVNFLRGEKKKTTFTLTLLLEGIRQKKRVTLLRLESGNGCVYFRFGKVFAWPTKKKNKGKPVNYDTADIKKQREDDIKNEFENDTHVIINDVLYLNFFPFN